MADTNNTYRNLALGGALAGLAAAYVLAPQRTAGTIILGTLGGMIATPLLAGASPSQLQRALFAPAK